MKVYLRLVSAILFIAALMICISGCEYDVAQSLWWEPAAQKPVPVITSIDPATAVAGVNLITINGENFGVNSDTNKIYFQNLAVDPIEVSEVEPIAVSATSITVRRPNLATDSCVVMVVRQHNAEVVAKSQPYQIDQVIENYGSFVEKDKFLTSVAVDADENIYVSSVDSFAIFKVVPGSGKNRLCKARQTPSDIKVGPDNRLYALGTSGTSGNRKIFIYNTQSGALEDSVVLAAGKNVKFGDFDANGYFYAGGGNKIDIWVIAPDLSFTAANLYTTNEVLGLKYYDNYLYVVAKTGTGASAVTQIFKHSVGANGALGAAEEVLNLTTAPLYGSRTFRALTFSNDGTMYIATDDENPLLVFDSGQLDYFYKDIVPSYVRDMNWGAGNYVYVTSGRTSNPTQDWTVYRIDMGSPGSR